MAEEVPPPQVKVVRSLHELANIVQKMDDAETPLRYYVHVGLRGGADTPLLCEFIDTQMDAVARLDSFKDALNEHAAVMSKLVLAEFEAWVKADPARLDARALAWERAAVKAMSE